MNKDRWAEYQHLRDSGLELETDNSIKFNAGGASETPQHIVANITEALHWIKEELGL